MDFADRERVNGCRFSWSIWPSCRVDSTKIVVPLGCMYTPLFDNEHMPLVEAEPIQCRSRDCMGVLNPYCRVDIRSKSWTCLFCRQRNAFPPNYADVLSEQTLPIEVHPTSSTIEYLLPHAPSLPPLYMFVVDTAVDTQELGHIKESLQAVFGMLPPETLVGLITYGTHCYVHELGFSAMSKSHAFRGNKEVKPSAVSAQLGIAPRGDPRASNPHSSGARRFILPLSGCDYMLSTILDEMSRDSWPVVSGTRPNRCTGVAIGLAVSLLELCHANQPCKIVLLTCGPCTVGPGTVAAKEMSMEIRSHTDIQKDMPNAKTVKPAVAYYTQVAKQAASSGHSIDIFACSLDQIGLYEMKVLCSKTGGSVVMADSCSLHTFKQSFAKSFECDRTGFVPMGFNARIDVVLSPELKVCGAIGNCMGLGKKTHWVSETEIGECGTCEWSLGTISRQSSYAFYFEPSEANPRNGAASQPAPGQQQQGGVHQGIGMNAQGFNGPQQYTVGGAPAQGYVQFQTFYNHPSGRRKLRVTTVAGRIADSYLTGINVSFDQEAAAVLMGRYAALKCETEESLDVLRWIDRTLIRLVSKFADYRKDDPTSFHLGNEMAIFPQYLYHFRRSPFLNFFNSSPDESVNYRLALMRENVHNSMLMIQPALVEYSFEYPTGRPVLLDATSLKPTIILLEDAYFYVVVWRGSTVQKWIDEGYHNLPEYSGLKSILDRVDSDALVTLELRSPVPLFVQTCERGSQERFLTGRVNPSVTYSTQLSNTQNGAGMYGLGTPYGSSQMGQAVTTDDVSLKVFIEHLVKMAVMS